MDSLYSRSMYLLNCFNILDYVLFFANLHCLQHASLPVANQTVPDVGDPLRWGEAGYWRCGGSRG